MSDHRGIDEADHVASAAYGYPPLPAPPYAPGTPWDGSADPHPLTGIATPHVARMALRAAESVQVVHPAGLRWLGLHRLLQLLLPVGAVLLGVALLGAGPGSGLGDVSPWAEPVLVAYLVLIPLLLLDLHLRLAKVDPGSTELPSDWPARVAGFLRAWRHAPAPNSPPSWPTGGESFAVLSVLARTDGIDRSWLYDRAGLTTDVGARWVGFLAHCGYLRPGLRLFGIPWLPTAVRISDLGREVLRAERLRLADLAVGD